MKRLLARVVRDLLLLPVTAFAVYQLVAHLPIPRGDEGKTQKLASVERQLREDMGVGQPLGFLRPWQKLWRGERLGDESHAYTGAELTRALGGSLRLGGVALLLALGWGALYALSRLAVRGRALDGALELLPALVYGTPSFLLALMVAMLTATPNFDFAWYPLLASLVMSVAPGAFLGVVLHDALRAELGRPYFTAALARGLSPAQALRRHALRNALPAVLDAMAPVATALVAGSFVAEQLFGLTYFGYLYLVAARELNVAVVAVATTVFACLLILVSLAVRLLRAWVDPRSRGAALEDAS